MTEELENTERSRILAIIREELSFPRIGEVQEVWPHTGDEDPPSNHEVDVSIPPGANPVREHRRVPVGAPTSGVMAPPQPGDKVLVQYRGGEGKKPVVTQVFYGDVDSDRAPKGDAGDVRANRGSLYAELEGDGSAARLAKKPDDTETPSAQVELDDTGKVTLETDADVVIRGTTSVTINQGGTAKAVLTEDAKFEYEQREDTSDGSGGTTTKTTTTVSNSETTSTKIE